MKPLSELPKRQGFRFVGIRHDDTRIQCRLDTSYRSRCIWWIDGNAKMVVDESKLAGWVPK